MKDLYKKNRCNVCRVSIPDKDLFCEKCNKLPYYPDKYLSSEERLTATIEDNSEFYTMDDD